MGLYLRAALRQRGGAGSRVMSRLASGGLGDPAVMLMSGLIHTSIARRFVLYNSAHARLPKRLTGPARRLQSCAGAAGAALWLVGGR